MFNDHICDFRAERYISFDISKVITRIKTLQSKPPNRLSAFIQFNYLFTLGITSDNFKIC